MNIKKFGIYLVVLLGGLLFTVAVGNFIIQYPAGTQLFKVDESGNANATGWLAEFNINLSDRYYLQTAIDTQGEVETIWGTTLATDTELANNISGVFDVTVNTTTTFSGDVTGTYDAINIVNAEGLDYHNVTTGMPTCGANELLKFDGTDLSCETDQNTGGTDVYVNETGDNVAYLNVTSGDINLSTTSTIRGNGQGSYFQFEADGDIIMVLG